MFSKKFVHIAAGVAALAILAGATSSRADICSASASAILSRSTGGSCPSALAQDQIVKLTYRIANASIVDGGPNDGNPVHAVISPHAEIHATLSQETANVGATELAMLEFVPVCPVGSTGGTKAAGDECDLNLSECGTGVCGCDTAVAGVTCDQGPTSNKVTLNIDQAIGFNDNLSHTIAIIRVKVVGAVPSPKVCGEFFSRMDSAGDILVVDDPTCESTVSAGAQASADLHAPVCLVDADCGDPLCNECVDVGTDPHCETANIGLTCGVDAETGDCLLPECVVNGLSGEGECLQEQKDVLDGTDCTSNGGAPVSSVACQLPACDSGACMAGQKPNPAEVGLPCPDTLPDNCFDPLCQVDGSCDQTAVCAPAESPVLCKVTISDLIFDDADHDGIQDAGELGLPNVDVDVYSCSGNLPQNKLGTDTTDASGLYSFSVPSCNPSEALSIDVSGNFATSLTGYNESDAFCDAGNPGSCGAETTPAVDSNCTNGISDCNIIARGATDETVDCGYSLPPPCDVDVEKLACVQEVGGECTGGAIAVLVQWTGPSALAAGSTVVLAGSSGVVSSLTLPADLQPGDNLLIPGQHGFSIDASGTAFGKLGSKLTLSVNGVTQQAFHTSCSCPDSYTVAGTTYHTNLVLGEPMCLDSTSPNNPVAAKGYPSFLWKLAGVKDPTNGESFLDPTGCNNVLPAAEGEACAIKDNKLTALRLEYVGAQGKANNCANKVAVFARSQDTGKRLKCTGTANDNQPVRIQVLSKDLKKTWFDSGAANINLGDEFTVLAAALPPPGNTELGGDLVVRVLNGGNAKIEELGIASECRERFVNVGDIYGGLKVVGTAGTKGGALPEDQCPEVEYRYSLTNAVDTSVRVCDDQLGDLGLIALQGGVPEKFAEFSQLTLVGGACAPLTNTVRVFPDSVACPSPADAVPPDDCGTASATLAPPPPPPYVCTKPMDSLTMIWNGPEPVNVTAWKGLVGSTSLGTVNGVVKGQEVTFTGFAGAPNDVVWQISGAVSGLSDFHLSCSDVNMNGPEDCGQTEGDAKGLTGFLNLWLLEGISGGGATLDCTP